MSHKHENLPTEKPAPLPRLPRFLLPIALAAGILAVAALMAGSQVLAAMQAWLQAAIILPLLLAAGMLGLAFTDPLARVAAFKPCGWPDAARLVLSLALGLGILALGTLGLGCIGGLQHGIPGLLLIFAAGIGYVPTRRFVREMNWGFCKAAMGRYDALLLLACVPIAVMLLAASFPPGGVWNQEKGWYDVLEYHLQMPREYAAANNTVPVPYNAYSYLPANVEMLYTMLMSLVQFLRPGDYLAAIYPAQMLHAIIVLLAAAAVGLAPLTMNTLGRVLAFLLMLATPWTLMIGSQAYDDGGVLLFGALAIVWGVGLAQQRKTDIGRKPMAIVVGALIGMAVGCKLTAGVMIAVPVALPLLARQRWGSVMVVSGVALLVYAPWAARDYKMTGNPVFPIAARTLGLGHWSAEQADQWTKAHGAAEGADSLLARAESLAEASLLDDRWSPSATTVAQWMSEKQLRPGEYPLWMYAADAKADEPPRWWWRLGLMWLLLPVVLYGAWRNGAVGWQMMLVAAAQMLAWMFLTHLQSRFLVPALVPLAVMVGLATESFAPPWRILLGVVVGLQATMIALVLLQDLKPADAGIAGHQASATPFAAVGELAQYPQDFTWPEALLAHPPEMTGRDLEQQTLLLVGSATPLYYTGKVIYSTAWDRIAFAEALREGGSAGAMEWLRERHVNYVVVDWSEVQRLRKEYGYDAEETITLDSFRAMGILGLQPLEMASRGPLQVFVIGPRE